MHILVEKFCNYYKEFSQESIPGLDEMYHQNVILQDPFSKLEGLDNVKQHFSQMMQNVSYCRFEIINIVSKLYSVGMADYNSKVGEWLDSQQ